MHKISLTALATTLAVAIAPAALAREHHHRHHHHRRHVKTHFERFGSQQSQEPGTTGAASTAGTIATFTNGTLTITLADGSSVSGAVTRDTEIECQMAGDNDNDDGVMSTEDRGPGGGDGDTGDDNGDRSGDGDNGNMCSAAALTTGAVVQEARLEISSVGAVWDRIVLQ